MKTKEFQDFILSKSLTETEKELAEFFLHCPTDPGKLSTRKIAEQLYVSDMTVLRFVRKLGYSNYAKFCADWFPEEADPSQKTGESYSRRKEQARLEFQSDLLFRVACCASENLKSGLQDISDRTLEEIVQILMSSRNRYIAGFQLNACCADYLSRKLQWYLKQVIAFTVEDTGQIERMIDMGPEDCLILFSFAPYTRMNEVLLKIAKEQRTKVVVITDKVTAPVASYGDICLTVPVKGAGDVKSYVVPMGISEAILVILSTRLEDLHAKEEDKTAMWDHYMKWYTGKDRR